MKVIHEKFNDQFNGIAVILSHHEYLTWWDYRNRPDQRRLQSDVSKTLRAVSGHSTGHAESEWINQVATQNFVDPKYVRGWIYDPREPITN